VSVRLLAELKTLADPTIAEHSQRFFKTGSGEYGEGDRFLGIRVPVLRKVSRAHRDLPRSEALKLLRSKWHEARLLALLILVERFRRGDAHERRAIFDAYLVNTPQHINNWDLIDITAPHVVGAWLVERPRRERSVLRRLARSRELWERRVAMIATMTFIRENDFATTLELAEILRNDEHDLMHKAVGWMLREVGNRDRATMEKFLHNRYKTMPRTMLRYAIERLPEQRRQQYLKGRV